MATKKTDEAAPAVWMKWRGGPGAHTPPLPSRNLTESDVRASIVSMEDAQRYAATGLWELSIPAGALPDKVDVVAPEG